MAIAYHEDFMQKLTEIKFGSGQWFVVAASVPGSSGPTDCRVSFPDSSGGTPGYGLWTPDARDFPTGPLTISQAMLKARLPTDAGQGFTGFGEQILMDGKIFVRVWLKIDKTMPSSPFRVRFIATVTPPLGGAGQFRVFTVVRNKMKAGLTTRGPNQVPLGSGENVLYNNAQTTDFRISPSTLEVTVA